MRPYGQKKMRRAIPRIHKDCGLCDSFENGFKPKNKSRGRNEWKKQWQKNTTDSVH